MLTFSKGDAIRMSFVDGYEEKKYRHETAIVTEVIVISNGKTIVEVKWAETGYPDLYYASELEEKIIAGTAKLIPVADQEGG